MKLSTLTSPFANVKWLRTWKRTCSPFSSRPTTLKTDVSVPEFCVNVLVNPLRYRPELLGWVGSNGSNSNVPDLVRG